MVLHDAFYKALPNEQRIYDYGTRVDQQPVYCGFARLGTAQSASEGWILVFTKYNADNSIASQYSLKGAWSSRVALFLPYA